MRSVLGLLPLAIASASPLFRTGSVHSDDAAPVLSTTTAKTIDDSYIVVFKDHVNHRDAAAHHGWVQELHTSSQSSREELRKRSQLPLLDSAYDGLKHTYNIAGSLLGYSGHFDEDVIEEIRRHPNVKYVERDQEVHTMETGETQKNSPWVSAPFTT